MHENVAIRTYRAEDWPALASIYPAAFPDEDLLPLLRSLLTEVSNLLSLVATSECRVLGHVVFTPCVTTAEDVECALLGPLAVTPAAQGRRIGSSLVRTGLRRLEAAGTHHVYVLGDPAYYGRLGFAEESRVLPPYALPDEWATAWQSQALGNATTPASGQLRLPPAWMDPALWLP